jgi:3D (Asp-Asp-Asp) domain-containing protein
VDLTRIVVSGRARQAPDAGRRRHPRLVRILLLARVAHRSRLRSTLLALVVVAALASAGCRSKPVDAAKEEPSPAPARFVATAYAVHGTTASGTRAHRGVVAADPSVLPLGTRIKVKGAGAHSGVYVVEDTGRAIQGNHIDIFEPDQQRAKQFGQRDVEVTVLERARQQH